MVKLPYRIVFLLLVGCGGGGGGHPDAAVDAPHGNPDSALLPPDADTTLPDAMPGTRPLLVKNYLSWCSVAVNGGAASSNPAQTVNVAPGTVVPLTTVALTGFQLGPTPWHDTDGDTGNGEAGIITGTGQSAQSATTATVMSAPKCVWVCCEFVGGGGCPATDQCP